MRLTFISLLVLVWVLFPPACRASDVAGQVVVKAKKENAATKWREYKTTLLKCLSDFKPAPVALSRYGGRADRKDKATGFFHAKETNAGWVLVDPEGCHFFSVGVCSTSPHDSVPDHTEAFAERFVDSADWAKKTHDLIVNSLRFNSLGCWSDWRTFKKAGREVPYVRRWNLMASYAKKKGVTYKEYGHTGFRNDVLPVFDQGFARHCDEICSEMKETRDDPWLIGHFTDNELPFKSDGILNRYLSSPEQDESHIVAARFLKENGITRESISSEHDTKFAELVLQAYYRTVHDAIRKHDPNHMILGSRLHGRAAGQDICYTASGPFVDVVSINYYHRWTPDQKELDQRAALAGKPILITEWYAKGADSGLKNAKGAGFTVPTQKDRGMFYENFAIGLLANKSIVGWHWFRYIDDGDLKTEGHSCNKGIVDLQYQEYRELGTSMRAVNSLAYQLADFLRKDLGDE